jgi:uncharacterized protein
MKKSSPFLFFLLVLIFSIPFWVLGAVRPSSLMPALPISALGVVCPLLAGLVLVYRANGWQGVRGLLLRTFDWKRMGSKWWLVPLFLLEPGLKLLAFGVQRAMGVGVPDLQITAIGALALFAVFFVGGAAEELGWSGYATDPLLERVGAVRASLLLGLVWAVWHYIPLLEAGRSWGFIAWWSLGTVASRVIILWLYKRTGGSAFTAIVYHDVMNVTWQLYPVQGSFFDPMISGVISALAAGVILLLYRKR